jgi:hypothetical protein
MKILEFLIILIFAIILTLLYNYIEYIYNNILNDYHKIIISLIHIILIGIYYCYFDNRQLNLHIL